MKNTRIAIIGAGNIGASIANGLAESELFSPQDIVLTRRRIHLLEEQKQRGFVIEKDNQAAVSQSEIIIIAVEPRQVDNVLDEIRPVLLPEKHTLISIVTGISTLRIKEKIDKEIPIVRAMPNTAIAVRQSMTCIASASTNGKAIEIAKAIFSTGGHTLVIHEEQMDAATALVACGIAFFFRAIRAASQGGIEIGFHSREALEMAAQTAKGAASLLLASGNHPESEIDKVTTPRGCTIAGLNRMEHEGFSSALIKGITVSAEKASKLYTKESDQD
ncbi:MAG: pyrroline-5-carboxylate reductase [Anaerolineales bacterium]|nr:pyrroline-5-carboxylate reductase [Anaerolineales bacterium]